MVGVTSKRIRENGYEFWEVHVTFEGSRELQEMNFWGNIKVEFIEDELKLHKGLKILFLGDGNVSLEVLYPPETTEELSIKKQGEKIYYRSIELPKRENSKELPSKEDLVKFSLFYRE